MKLIDTEDLLAAARLNGFAGESAAKVLMLLSRFSRINKIYSRNIHREGHDFIDSVIEQLGINFEVDLDELKHIPKEGPFITISNHPFGGIDGLLLIKMIATIREDYKVLGNFLLRRMEPVKDYIFPDNPFEKRISEKPDITSIRVLFQHLESGKPFGIFPAGEVSGFNPDVSGISDHQWLLPAIRMIKKAGVPVIPIYFQGKNSKFFHLLGRLHSRLQTVKLPTEMFNKKKKLIRVRIGSPITIKEQDEFSEVARYGRFMRAKTYALGTTLEVKKFFKLGGRRLKAEEPVINSIDPIRLQQEVNRIAGKYLLFRSNHYLVICAPSVEMPEIMNELGRLREKTFREIGEGTNQQMDIDEYDLYYNQLFIWDEEERKIVGAYRVGKGNEIMQQYGIRGFYLQSLFRMSRRFYPILRKSLELGRSFIVSEYQKKPMSLFLLWKGILYFLIKNPEYRYLVGPVSISNRFSNFSKALMIKFIRDHYYNHDVARFIRSRKSFRVKIKNFDTDIIIGDSNDLNKLDKLIKDIETTHYNMPVLLKKYLKQSGKIIGFNIDPKFNNALDGLIILDLFDVPPDTIAALSREINDVSILERFSFNGVKLTGNVNDLTSG
jgi:putative hemolysin